MRDFNAFVRSRASSIAAASLFLFAADSGAAPITFLDDPFANSTVLTTAGRQILGGEPSITFDIVNDYFEFNPLAFGISSLTFANDVIGGIPASGANAIVLRTFDNDANAATSFGAGNAANLLAAQITAPTAGFFIYFNSGLDMARLVYSVDLSDPTSDLAILARLTNFSGSTGQLALAGFTAADFTLAQATPVPEPSPLLLIGAGLLCFAVRWRAVPQYARRFARAPFSRR